MGPDRWSEIERICHEALERPPAERAAFLERTCSGDGGLRAEVESLLACEDAAEGFLNRPALEQEARAMARDSRPAGAAEAPPEPGQIFSHYRILHKLDEGGMGAVYEAEDVRLGRRVALKLLTAASLLDASAAERFEVEAKAASALSHPNICTVYDIGERNKQPFLVMELLDGTSLRDTIDGTSMPIATLLDLAIQIADALDAAHRRGILHRDIKPGNLFVTRRGQAKVLDFGVAKILPAIAGRATAAALTAPGAAIGTVAYMSPEQARGEDLDARTDVFSLGVVLYEMATGRPAFSGKTTAVIFHAILSLTPPAPAELNPQLPAGLDEIIRRSMEKDREKRYASAADLRDQLKALQRQIESGQRVAVGAARPRWKRMLWPGLAASAASIAAAWLWLPAVSLPWTRPEVLLQSAPFTSLPGEELDPAFSPDGNTVAFVWNGGTPRAFSLYVQLIGESTPVPLTHGPDDRSPAWSPDGRYIAFVRRAAGKVQVLTVPLFGGPERSLGEIHPSADPAGLAWAPDGKSLAVVDKPAGEADGIFLLSAQTGDKKRITTAPPPAVDSLPAFSPDGRTLSFARWSGSLIMDLFTIPVSGGQPTQLTHERSPVSGNAWTRDGGRLVFGMQRGGTSGLWTVAVAGGAVERVLGADNSATMPAVSAKGNRLAYATVNVSENIWRYRIPPHGSREAAAADRNPPLAEGQNLITSSHAQGSPQYSPDGARVAFVSTRSGSAEIWVSASDGSNPVRLTSVGGYRVGTPRWSPDGQSIAFDSRLGGNPDIYVVGVSGGAPRQLTTDSTQEMVPSWSRDGRSIYFCSDRSGQLQIWKTPAGGGTAVQVTRNGGFEGFESADGQFLYYTQRKAPGLWRTPAAGGTEIAVEGLAAAGWPRAWGLTARGVYYIPLGDSPIASFFEFATGRTCRLFRLKVPPSPSTPTLTVSPDDRWILYTQVDADNSDIMLADNFR